MGKGFLLSLVICFLSSGVAQAAWTLSVRGEVFSGKKQLRPESLTKSLKSQSLPPTLELRSQSGSLTLKRGGDAWTLEFDKKTRFTLTQVDDAILRGKLLAGGVKLRAHANNAAPFVMDFGDWQLRKIHGTVTIKDGKVLRSDEEISSEMSIRNDEGSLWMKKEIMGAQEIPAQTQFKIQNGADVFAFEPIAMSARPMPWNKKWHLGASATKTKKGRVPASARKPVNAAKTLCQSPSAQFEQCAWKCFGGGRDRCDTGFAQTHCVRFTCTADGQWKMPTLVPGGECTARESRVDQCQ